MVIRRQNGNVSQQENGPKTGPYIGPNMQRRNPLSTPIGVVPATLPERLFTPEALHRAWLAVKRSGGGKGVDSSHIASFEKAQNEELDALRQALIDGSYRPKPVRQMLFPKQNGGLRPIALWALRDRVAQRVVYDIIVPSFESVFLPCSFGFRAGLGVADAVQRLVEHRERNLRWVADCDIKNCFEQINPNRLLPLIQERVQDKLLIRYIKLWLDAKIFNSADGVPHHAGVSQGSVLSPLLANIYLHQVDLLLMGMAPTARSGHSNHSSGDTAKQREQPLESIAYLRYADDLLFCSRTKQEALAGLDKISAALVRWGLSLNEHKSSITHFDQGFSWLGHFFVGNKCYRI